VGAVPIDHDVLDATFEDEVTPNGGAAPVFTDDGASPDGLAFANSTYKVVFLAFPMESYGTAAQRADLVTRVMGYLGS
jgi:hypothetical protein